MRELLGELSRALGEGRDCVYCAVVETRGSTPQKAGAVMLVFPDGSQRGTLGGGCVEAEVKRQALRVLVAPENLKPDVFTFCLDDNYGWDDGLICGGRMAILADPLARCRTDGQAVPHSPSNGQDRLAQAASYYQQFQRLVETGQGCIEAAVIAEKPAGVPVGSRYLFDGSGQLVQQLASLPPPEMVRRHLPDLAKRPKPTLHEGIAYLPILPRITLLIVGGGHVGQAVGKLAADVDFDVWVLDDRAAYANQERFPQAQRHIVGDIGAKLQELSRDIQPSVYAIIVTRGHGHDEEALYHLVTTPAGYVGMIGSKRKIKLIYEDLLARGIAAEELARVHAPLGFAIGSQTVPEIAVSIVAELIAHRNLGQKSEGQKTEVRGQRSEVRDPESELCSPPTSNL